MSLVQKVTRLVIAAEPEGQTVHLTAPIARHTVDWELEREQELMRATGEVFKEAMYEMSEVERRASFWAGVTAAVRDHHAKLAEARNASPAEQAAQQERFENYLRRLGQLAELGNRALIVEAVKATEAISERASGRSLGSLSAHLVDTLVPGLPPGKRR
jgi:hypothetical protein